MVPHLFTALCMPPYRLPVRVVAAPVLPLLSTSVAPVLLLYSLPIPVALLLFQALFRHRCYFPRYPLVELLSPPLLFRLPWVAALPK